MTVASRASEDRAELQFLVRDTGIGIPQDRQSDVFRAFTQVDASISRRHGGVGLGLAICDRLVSAMGGDIRLRSKPDLGTTVEFVLPFDIAAADEAGDASLADTPAAMVRLNILLVEDDATNRMVASNYLRQLGHSVVEADRGERALALLDVEPIDLMLLDISLPGMDGLEIFDRIRRHADPGKRNTPVIAMSAHVFKEEVDQYLGAGMHGFLGKPFSLEDLASSIAMVVAGSVPALLSNASETGPVLDPDTVVEDIQRLGAANVRALVDTFAESGSQYLRDISRFTADGDAASVADVAHKMRGAAGNFGLLQLCFLLTELELACTAGNLDPSLVDERIRTSYQESLEALARVLQEHADASQESISTV